MSRRADAPSLGVVVAGGIGVLVVLAFVGAVALGGTSRSRPGDHVAVVRAGGPAGVAVLAGRCLDQRVRTVRLADARGTTLWAVTSRKGSIERRFVVGGEPPLGFTQSAPLATVPSGRVRAEVTFEQGDRTTTDARTVDLATVPSEGATLTEGAPACGGHEGPGATVLLFAAGAVLVVAGYAGMLLRLRR